MTTPRSLRPARGREVRHLASCWGPRIATAFLLAGALLGVPRIARSETCPCPKLSIEEAVRQASAIFVGNVVATTSRPGRPPAAGAKGAWANRPGEVDVQEATIQVREMFKGRVSGVVVVSSPSLCGYPLAAGGTYLVFATRNEGGLWTDACKPNASGATVPVRAADVRRALQPPAPPEQRPAK